MSTQIPTISLSASYQIRFPKMADLLPSFLERRFYPAKKIADIREEDYFLVGKNYRRLRPFFDKLQKLEKEKKQVVRILHHGDSIIWGGFITEGIEEAFHEDFGDGGRGLVPVIDTLDRRLHKHINRTSKNQVHWHSIKIMGQEKQEFGFLGESAQPRYSRLLSQHKLKLKSPWQKLEIYYRAKQTDLNRHNIIINNQIPSEIQTKKIAPCQLVTASFAPSKKLNIQLKHKNLANIYLDALNLESQHGIAYSVVSRTGFEMNELRQVAAGNLHCGLQLYQPDLILFQFGVNESHHMRHYPKIRGPKVFRENFAKTLMHFQKNAPNSTILVIGPAERVSRNKGGKLDTMPEVLKLVKIQREITQKLDIAYYDTFLALGGSGQNLPMYKKGYLQGDRTHFTRKGGRYFAKIFYNDIMNHYRKYIGHQEKIEKHKMKQIARLKQDKAINFNSRSFFYFFLCVFSLSVLFSIIGVRSLRLTFLVLASYYFYASWNPNLLFLILFSTILDYLLAIKIYRNKKQDKKAGFYLFLSILANLSLLFFFKYFQFATELLHKITIWGTSIPLPPDFLNMPIFINNQQIAIPLKDIILPVGISFYTFQTMSYTIDIWYGKTKPEYNFLKFSLYVSFFPQLVAGPIVRAVEFLPKMKEGIYHFRLNPHYFSYGIFLIFWGLVKKNGADWLAVNIVDRVYANPSMYTSLDAITAFYAYGLQIYGDFSGYTDIALGAAMLLGFHLTKNFARPYTSFSITEFWRRWHISLGSWFRNYLYIPLGGNQRFLYRNLIFTMLLCGIWHGAGLAFFFWGAFHGTLLILERLFQYKKHSHHIWLQFLQWFLSLHLVLFGWIIFRSDSLETFEGFFSTLFNHTSIWNPDYTILMVIFFGYLFCLFPKKLFRKIQYIWLKSPIIFQSGLAASLTILLYNIKSADIKPFIYFQF